MESKKILGLLIQQARKEKGINQSELAKLMGVKRQYVSNLERGVSLSTGSLDKALDALGVELKAYTVTAAALWSFLAASMAAFSFTPLVL